MLLLVRLRICGRMRFLSHAEMLRVFQRACVRTRAQAKKPRAWSFAYSCGFNPRMRLSLPLPKSVGLECEGDLACIRIEAPSKTAIDPQQFKDELSAQLPKGCELLEVSVAETNAVPVPTGATYVLSLRPEAAVDRLKEKIAQLLGKETLIVKRPLDAAASRFKEVDVRGFLESVELSGSDVVVRCRVTAAGTIRVDEISELLEIGEDMPAGPVRRTDVRWERIQGLN
jgi:radical SAM-linked protein